jgi:hypothetical protein
MDEFRESDMRRRLVALVLALFLLTAGLATSPPPAAAAAPTPYIGGFGIEYAPKHRNGAVVLPWMGCPSGAGSNVATVVSTKTNKTMHRSWMNGMSFVSLPPGTYRVSIRSSCDGASSSYTGTRTIKRETDKNTITKSEFKRIKKGMSLKKVKKIVGNTGLDFGSTHLLDHRANFGWAELQIRKGKVTSKWWHAELGDVSVR